MVPRVKSPCRRDMRFVQVALDIKAANVDGEKGTFTGLASVFDVVDHDGDIIRSGAFNRTLKEWTDKGQLPAMFWMHQMAGGSVGDWTSMKVTEQGLAVDGQLFLGNATEEVRKAHNQVTSAGPKGLSVGFMVPPGAAKRIEVETADGPRFVTEITDLDLWEVSIVPFGANADAVILEAKGQGSLLHNGKPVSIKHAEAFLREVGGLPRSHAKALLAGGWGRLGNQREAGGGSDEVVKALETLTNEIKDYSYGH